MSGGSPVSRLRGGCCAKTTERNATGAYREQSERSERHIQNRKHQRTNATRHSLWCFPPWLHYALSPLTRWVSWSRQGQPLMVYGFQSPPMARSRCEAYRQRPILYDDLYLPMGTSIEPDWEHTSMCGKSLLSGSHLREDGASSRRLLASCKT